MPIPEADDADDLELMNNREDYLTKGELRRINQHLEEAMSRLLKVQDIATGGQGFPDPTYELVDQGGLDYNVYTALVTTDYARQYAGPAYEARREEDGE